MWIYGSLTFFVFVEVLHWWLWIWRSNNITYWLFERDTFTCQPTQGFWGFPQTFSTDVPASHFLFRCGCGEFLRLYAFFQSSKARVVEVPVGPLWGSAGEMSLVASGWASWCALVSRKDCEVVTTFFLSLELRYFALSFSQPLVLQITWVKKEIIWVKKEMCPAQMGKLVLTHSYFPLWRKSWLQEFLRALSHTALEEAWWRQSKTFFDPFQCVYSWIFSVLEVPLKTLSSLNNC